jgi:NIPSNAP
MSRLTYSPIVELRMYALHPGRRDELIRLFEREFIESQEAVGIQLIGQFYDLDDPNRFVWLRGFHDMAARAKSLEAFYSGPVWKAHREAANATMINSDNVLLLRLPDAGCGFSLNGTRRPSLGSRAKQDGFVAATIYYFDKPVDSDFIRYFEHTIQLALSDAGASVLAYFVTEDSSNTFPRLPVREGENAFVWFAGFPDQEAHKRYLSKLRESKFWKEEVETFLKRHLQGKPDVLRLTPTPRSWLTGK